jgi:hypothetical protein
MARALIIIGLMIVAVGLLWPSNLGVGRLPGDIVIRRDGFSFYFPIVTCLILSAVASLVIWFIRR